MEYQADLRETARAAHRLVSALGGEWSPPGGSLTVVGTGIRAISQLTLEALSAMANAEMLFHLIGEPTQEDALRTINPTAEDLTVYYVDGMDRSLTYEMIVQRVLSSVMDGKRTVAAFYGHPGVFTYPSHESVSRSRAAGYPARMLPAVSATDCLYADLGVDPGAGCQEYDATDFLLRNRPVDPQSSLILWQVGTLGNWTYESYGYELPLLPALVRRLRAIYPPVHPVTAYEAPFDPVGVPRVVRGPLARLQAVPLTPATTLHLPPLPVALPR